MKAKVEPRKARRPVFAQMIDRSHNVFMTYDVGKLHRAAFALGQCL